MTSTQLASTEWKAADQFEPLTDEKVIGLNNLLSIAWLGRALELAAPVVRIVLPVGTGSGFLIAPDLLLTNHHVLPDEKTADAAVAEFNYQVNWAGTLEPVRRFTFDSALFRTSKELDYTMVRVRDGPGDAFGFVDLATRAVPAVNDYVSIIQQPQGGPKQVCITDNKVAAVFGNVVQYSTDTEPGSSGSPVFNQAWQLVALHHKGGALVGPDGKRSFANEGVLISSIVRDAAAFLSLPDALYDLAFGDLRAALVRLVGDGQPAPDELATDLLRTRPRFSYALEEWGTLYGDPGTAPTASISCAGVAIGGALRQWARGAGHESIKAAVVPALLPSPELVAVLSGFAGTDNAPSAVYAAILAALRKTPALLPAPPAGEGLAAVAKAFLAGVVVGAYAHQTPAAVA